MKSKKRKILRVNERHSVFWIEPVFFIFFGLLHMHRIWGLIDRETYADFWLTVMMNRDAFYFSLMGAMSLFCIGGIILFILNRHNLKWWRWVYIFGGAYVIFDLFAIFTGLEVWTDLLNRMFDVNNPLWNLMWGAFIILGSASFIIGIWLAVRKITENKIK